MARRARLSLPGLPHLVRQHAVFGQALVLDDDDRRALLDSLLGAAQAQGVAVWAYAIGPGSLSVLACPPTAVALGRAMQAFGRRYVTHFNRRHARSGALWGGRFRACVLEPGEWVLTAMADIERPGTEPGTPAGWSSAGHHVGERADARLADPPEWWQLGNTPFERESAWRERLRRPADPAHHARLARAVHGAWVVGSDAFVDKAAAMSGRPAGPRRPGRPAKTRRDIPAGQ